MSRVVLVTGCSCLLVVVVVAKVLRQVSLLSVVCLAAGSCLLRELCRRALATRILARSSVHRRAAALLSLPPDTVALCCPAVRH